MKFRRVAPSDYGSIWSIIEPVIRSGETYAYDRDMNAEQAINIWCKAPKGCYVVEDQSDILGTFYIKTNQAGGGSHVCNAGFITSEKARGRGIGRYMGTLALKEAQELGYSAMQFNFVLANNLSAVRLWRSLDFWIVGTLPEAFRHPTDGLIDAYVMYRRLGSEQERA